MAMMIPVHQRKHQHKRKGAQPNVFWPAMMQRRMQSNQVANINKKRYVFDRELGHGAFGSVYAARQIPENLQVAVKVIALNPRNRAASYKLYESIMREIAMSKRLSKMSPHIVHMFDFDFDSNTGRAYIVMELGQNDLEKTLQTRPMLAPFEVKNIWRQIANLATTLHSRGVVHLDIKPQNLVVFPGNIIKLADLGIAEKANTYRFGPNGTPYYSAPEVVYGPAYFNPVTTTKSDTWSWGAVLYRLVYGRPPSYSIPCFQPPPGIPPTPDPNLQDLLQRTLVYDVAGRLDPPMLAHHPYTTTP